MDKLVQKVDWNMPNSKPCQMYMYGEASFEANQEMQEPLEKLYQYENSPDASEVLAKYLSKIDTKIRDVNYLLNVEVDSPFGERMRGQRQVLQEVRNDLEQMLITDLKKDKVEKG